MEKRTKLEELFDQWEAEERAKLYAAIAASLKELYGSFSKDLIYKDNPYLKLIPKDSKKP